MLPRLELDFSPATRVSRKAVGALSLALLGLLVSSVCYLDVQQTVTAKKSVKKIREISEISANPHPRRSSEEIRFLQQEVKAVTRVPITAPYIGLAPQSIRQIDLAEGASYVMSVENLTTFHEIALGKSGKPRGLVVYTAGMPSPALRRVYGACLEKALADGRRARLHWGDIDLGGFRIAACLAREHASPLHLWAMDPVAHPGAPARKTLTGDELSEITRIAARYGWEKIAENVCNDKRAIEQEAMQLALP